MIRNYFLLFFRNLRRQKVFSFINLLGLTVSIVSTLLIYLHVRHEFSYDRFHHDVDRIYRVNQTFIWGEGDKHQFASTGPGVAYALQAELPEAELITSIHTPGNFIVSYTNPKKEVISFEEEKVLAADTNFFKMFNFPLIKGNPDAVFRQAQTLVMTESTARKYFGDADPIGKLVQLGAIGGGETKTYEVTGVVRDLPTNSYIDFHVMLSMNSFPHVKRFNWSWVWTQLETFIRLREGTDLANTKGKLITIPKKYAEETLRRAMNTSYDEYVKSGKTWQLFLQPLTSIHLPTEIVYNRLSDAGDIKIVYSLIGAAVFIILLSCVNFMNLSMAQFTRRIKEASVRKILGLGRYALSAGYFVEAMIFCLIALVAALALAQLLLPGFNLITGKSLELNLLGDPGLIGALITLVVGMAVISSCYPAFFLSGFHPVEGMKGKLKAGREGQSFRSGLVVFQFCVSIVLMVCTAIVFQQLKYISEKNIGFDRENLMVLKHVESIKDGEAFANAALAITGVANASHATSVPPALWGGDTFGADGMNGQNLSINYTLADERYVPTLKINMKVGRNFSLDIPADADRVILNEAAVKKIGWNMDESVVGKKIERDGAKFEVVGVVSDFNYWPLAAPIAPMAIFNIKTKNISDGKQQFLTMRVSPQNGATWQTTMAQLKKLWKVHAGDTPLVYEFVDQDFEATFKSQAQFGKVLTVMAVLAILIACLGLLGIIIYSLEQRSKEIGIRKVSGASVWNILTLISRGYTKLILIAIVIGSPIAYWMMEQWLRDFSTRITPSPVIYVAIGAGTLVVAVLITLYHSVRAATINPVDVLRDE